MIKKIIIFLLKPFFGLKVFQNLFQFIHYIGIRGMHYGQGAFVGESGECFVIDFVQKKAKGKLILFDVGGNVGKYSKLLDSIIPSNRTIHAFEPSKITSEKFKETTKGISELILNNCGLSDEKGELELFYDKETSGLSSLYQRDLKHANIEMSKSEMIKLIRLDDYCENNAITTIDLLKIDVEGHELAVLKGCGKLLSDKKIKNIQFEFGGCNIDSRTYFKDFYNLLSNNYKIYRIIKNNIIEINTYTELNEIFTTVNYFAELK